LWCGGTHPHTFGVKVLIADELGTDFGIECLLSENTKAAKASGRAADCFLYLYYSGLSVIISRFYVFLNE
jgi:hypothetical protein